MTNFYDSLPTCLSINKHNKLCINGIPCDAVAQHCGTPAYIYSWDQITNNIDKILTAFKENLDSKFIIYYAYKGNSSPAICRLIHSKGVNAEVMSLGELHQAISLGVNPKNIVFNGLVKTQEELEYAIRAGISHIIVDSETETKEIQKISAQYKTITNIAYRVKPGITIGFHPHVETGQMNSKFGLTEDLLVRQIEAALSMPNVKIIGLQCHIGSQIVDIAPYLDAARHIFNICKRLNTQFGVQIAHIDLGGGFGVQNDDHRRCYFDFKEFASNLDALVKTFFKEPPVLSFEPSRSLVADSGIFLTKVISIKKDAGFYFAGCDGGYSSFIRPMLYDAYHDIRNTDDPTPKSLSVTEIVGPVCETGDILGKKRKVGEVYVGSLLALLDAGSYGYAQASQYNGRPRPPEYIVNNNDIYLIRAGENVVDILGNFFFPPIYNL